MASFALAGHGLRQTRRPKQLCRSHEHAINRRTCQRHAINAEVFARYLTRHRLESYAGTYAQFLPGDCGYRADVVAAQLSKRWPGRENYQRWGQRS